MPDDHSERDDVDPELEYWRDSGFSPAAAQDWMASGFDVEEAGGWSDRGFSSTEAQDWIASGFDTDEAEDWKRQNISPEKAAMWRTTVDRDEQASEWDQLVGTPTAAQEWMEVGFESDEAHIVHDVSRPGSRDRPDVTPFEVEQWNYAGVDWGPMLELGVAGRNWSNPDAEVAAGKVWDAISQEERNERLDAVRAEYKLKAGSDDETLKELEPEPDAHLAQGAAASLPAPPVAAPATSPSAELAGAPPGMPAGVEPPLLGRDRWPDLAPPLPSVDTAAAAKTDTKVLSDTARADLLQHAGTRGPRAGLVQNRLDQQDLDPAGLTAGQHASQQAPRTPANGIVIPQADDTTGRPPDGSETAPPLVGKPKAKGWDRVRGGNSSRAGDDPNTAPVGPTGAFDYDDTDDGEPDYGGDMFPQAETQPGDSAASASRQPTDGGKKKSRLALVVAAGGTAFLMLILVAVFFRGSARRDYQSDQMPTPIADTIPIQYLDQYRAAAAQYGLPWSVLAAIGGITSDHGRENAYAAPATTPGTTPSSTTTTTSGSPTTSEGAAAASDRVSPSSSGGAGGFVEGESAQAAPETTTTTSATTTTVNKSASEWSLSSNNPQARTRRSWSEVFPPIEGDKGEGPMLLNPGVVSNPQDATTSIFALAKATNERLDAVISRTDGANRADMVQHPFIPENTKLWQKVIEQLPVDQEAAAKRLGLLSGGGANGPIPVGDPQALVKAFGWPLNAAKAVMVASEKATQQWPTCHMSVPIIAATFQRESEGYWAPPDANGGKTGGDGKYHKVLDNGDVDAPIGDDTGDGANSAGPSQFIPGTWAAYGQDGDGNGVKNPQNFYDATLAMQALLCSGNRDLSTDTARKAAWGSYNGAGPASAYAIDAERRYQEDIQKLQAAVDGGGGTTPTPVASTTTTAAADPSASTTTTAPSGGSGGGGGSLPATTPVFAVGDSILVGISGAGLQDGVKSRTADFMVQVGKRVTVDGGSGNGGGDSALTILKANPDKIQGRIVILLVGHNQADNYAANLEQLLKLTDPASKVLLVTNVIGGTNGLPEKIKNEVNPAIEAAPSKHPNVQVVDITTAVAAHPEWQAGDTELHLHPAGGYADLAKIVLDAVNGATGNAGGNGEPAAFAPSAMKLASIYSGFGDPTSFKTGGGAGGSGSFQTATAGSYTLPFSRDLWDAHKSAFLQPHHDFPSSDISWGGIAGTPAYAVTGGTVLNVTNPSDTSQCGNGVIWKGDDGVEYGYCHSNEPAKVHNGDKITVGQELITVGCTGSCTGDHLHVQIIVGGKKVCPGPLFTAWAAGTARVPDIGVNAECPSGQSGVGS